MNYFSFSSFLYSVRHKLLPFIVGIIIGLSVNFILFSLTLCTDTSMLVPWLSGTEAAVKVSISSRCQAMSAAPPLPSNRVSEDFLAKVKVLCWVPVSPKYHKNIEHIRQTWGKRCDKILFMSSEADPKFGTVGLNTIEGYYWLWDKTKLAFKHVWQHHRDHYDWFMKADMDTYVMVDNLKFMLKDYNSSRPIYFGYPFGKGQGISTVYFSGGSGYVLSKEALRRFVTNGMRNPKLCKQNHIGAEDAEMGICMENVGVEPGDSRDELGLHRFMAVGLKHLLYKNFPLPSWYTDRMVYPQEQGMECCSDRPIAFHYVEPLEMYVYEYLLYHARPFGVTRVQERSVLQQRFRRSNSMNFNGVRPSGRNAKLYSRKSQVGHNSESHIIGSTG